MACQKSQTRAFNTKYAGRNNIAESDFVGLRLCRMPVKRQLRFNDFEAPADTSKRSDATDSKSWTQVNDYLPSGRCGAINSGNTTRLVVMLKMSWWDTHGVFRNNWLDWATLSRPQAYFLPDVTTFIKLHFDNQRRRNNHVAALNHKQQTHFLNGEWTDLLLLVMNLNRSRTRTKMPHRITGTVENVVSMATTPAKKCIYIITIEWC